MKRAGISFLMIFVLMLPWGTQVFAEDGNIIAVANGNEGWSSYSIHGQHGYGLFEAILSETSTRNLTVTLFEVSPTNVTRPIHEIYATPDNRKVQLHYYLEGGKNYKIRAFSQGYGVGRLYNYIP